MYIPLSIVAITKAKPESVDIVKAELLKLIDPTRQEVGCIQYNLHQDNNDPSVFIFYEQWQSLELLQQHLQSAHIEGFKSGTEGHLISFEVTELTRIA